MEWVDNALDYAALISPHLGFLRPSPDGLFPDVDGLAVALRNGTVDAQGKTLESPEPLQIPAFERGRAGCLDYLFLAGFNQNIIDFMNQSTSEILDSIDPIYPDSDEQSDERFFVRYANHRAMVTYVPKSRSLETGNDYIGTCPMRFSSMCSSCTTSSWRASTKTAAWRASNGSNIWLPTASTPSP